MRWAGYHHGMKLLTGEGFSLQARTLLTSLPSISSPVVPSESSCITGMKEKLQATTGNISA